MTLRTFILFAALAVHLGAQPAPTANKCSANADNCTVTGVSSGNLIVASAMWLFTASNVPAKTPTLSDSTGDTGYMVAGPSCYPVNVVNSLCIATGPPAGGRLLIGVGK